MPNSKKIFAQGQPLLRTSARFLLELALPRRCQWCGSVVGFAPQCVCAPQMLAATRPQGETVPDNEHIFSHFYEGTPPQGEAPVFAPFFYISPVKEAIWAMKFYGKVHLVAPYAQKMALELGATGRAEEYDMLVPVPGAKDEYRGRDNIPKLLAQAIGELLQISVSAEALMKTKKTERQMHLSGAARRKNVLDAYAASQPQGVAGSRVLLVDDVVTTGATLNECAKALYAAGAAQCGAVCIAMTRLPPTSQTERGVAISDTSENIPVRGVL